jgi:precorrin-6A/cobalt-precorrin-6A reductase
MSGTADGREIVRQLDQAGASVRTTVATSYGQEVLERMGLGHLCVRARLSGDGLPNFIEENGVDTIIDATHPYAVNASVIAMEACKKKNTRYIRFQRDGTPLPQSLLIHQVDDVDQAVDTAGRLGKRILLTTGFKSAEDFSRLLKDGGDYAIIVRILPMPDHISRCIEMGISQKNIIAAQGPFSKEFNIVNIRDLDIHVVVTKDGGKEAKMQEKIDACLETQTPLVIIQRPILDYPITCSSTEELLSTLDL